MYFPALLLGLRRLGRGLVYELLQVVLWAALVLRTLGSLRSAIGGGGALAVRRPGRPVRPRRGPGGALGRRVNSAAAA